MSMWQGASKLRLRTTRTQVCGAVVRAFRELAGFRQKSVAASIGLKQPAWSKVERGLTSPTLEQVCLVGEVLGFDVVAFGLAVNAVIDRLEADGVFVFSDLPRRRSGTFEQRVRAAIFGDRPERPTDISGEYIDVPRTHLRKLAAQAVEDGT